MARHCRPRLFVDMDKCTVLTLEVSQQEDNEFEGRFTHIAEIPPCTERASIWGPYLGDIVISAARPSAQAFLIELAKLGDVEILTNGLSSHQIPILRGLGLLELVKFVWCRDNIDQMPVPRRCRWVLIDDHPVDERIKTKMEWLGVCDHPSTVRWHRHIKERFVQCRRWTVVDQDPQPLTDLLPLVAAKLERQKHRRRRR